MTAILIGCLLRRRDLCRQFHKVPNMSDDVKKELGDKSPFEVYFGRKSNYVQCPNAESDPESEGDEVMNRPKIWPTLSKKDISDLEVRCKLLAKAAYQPREMGTHIGHHQSNNS